VKYQIELSLTQRSHGKLIVEAPTRGGAETLSRYIKANDVANWRLCEGSLSVLSITPALESEAAPGEAATLLPDEVLDAMREVVDYLHEDAAEDYPTAEHRDGHIFESVSTLDSWLGRPEIRRTRSCQDALQT